MRLKYHIYRLIFKLFPLRKSPLLTQPHSILLVPFDALGDMIMTTPVFRELKRAWPAVKIGVVTTARNAAILANNPHVDKIYPSNGRNYFINYQEWRCVQQIRHDRYDVVIDLWDRVSLLKLLRLRLFKPRQLIGLEKPPEIAHAKGFVTEQLGLYSIVVKTDFSNFHNYMLSSLSYFSLTCSRQAGDIFFTPDNLSFAQKYLADLGEQICFVNIYGSQAANTLSIEILTEIITLICENSNYMIVLNCTNNMEQKPKLAAAIPQQYLSRVKILPAATSLLDMAAVIQASHFVLTTNTGILHIAEALQKPLILLEKTASLKQHEKFPLLSYPERKVLVDQPDFPQKIIFLVQQIIADHPRSELHPRS